MLRIHRSSLWRRAFRVCRVTPANAWTHRPVRYGYATVARQRAARARRARSASSGVRRADTAHVAHRRQANTSHLAPDRRTRGQRSPQRRATSVTKRPRRAPARVYDAHSPFTPPHQRHAPPRRSPEPRKPLRSRGALPLAVENTLGSALDSARVSALGSSTARFRPMPI